MLNLTGASSGGDFVYDTACDPVTSTQFRGFAAVSALMQTAISGSSPVSGTEQCGAPGQGQTKNTSFFMMNIHGTNDEESIGSAASHGCIRMTESDAVALARYLMEHTGASKPDSWYDNVRGGSKPVDVYLPHTVPIAIGK